MSTAIKRDRQPKGSGKAPPFHMRIPPELKEQLDAEAARDGTVNSDAQVSLFLTRWLALAQKQRRFPREVAPDITWLLNQGRALGVAGHTGC